MVTAAPRESTGRHRHTTAAPSAATRPRRRRAEVVLVHPHPPAPEVARVLGESGFRIEAADRPETGGITDQGEAVVVWMGAQAAAEARPLPDKQVLEGLEFLQASRGSAPAMPVLVLADEAHLPELVGHRRLFDDFCVWPASGTEVQMRLRALIDSSSRSPRTSAEMLRRGSLTMNLETYQASIAGRPLDLTFMEYKLLSFLAASPGKVFTREALLSEVWGYDYFGGARTVDVHIRRLRAKLGEEHARMIQTVRSVGYRFGRSAA